jgi:hypothetical protein
MVKKATMKEKRHMADVASIGCIICGGPAQVHHCETHMGGGRDHLQVIPLCVGHHTSGGYGVALHAGKKAFERNHGTEQDLLSETARRMAK